MDVGLVFEFSGWVMAESLPPLQVWICFHTGNEKESEPCKALLEFFGPLLLGLLVFGHGLLEVEAVFALSFELFAVLLLDFLHFRG